MNLSGNAISLLDLDGEIVSNWSLYSHEMLIHSQPQVEEKTNDLEEAVVENLTGLTCSTCNLAFEDVAEQKIHFKTPLHVYNLKRKRRLLPIAIELPEDDASSDEDESDEEDAPRISYPEYYFSDSSHIFKVRCIRSIHSRTPL
jgi:hypothetical protein